MPVYTYQKKPIDPAQILSSTGLVPLDYGSSAPQQEFFEFALPLTVDEEAALDQFEDDLGFEPIVSAALVVPSLFSFSGSFNGAVGVVTAFFSDTGKGLASLTAIRRPVLSPSMSAKVGLRVDFNTLLTDTEVALSVSGAGVSGAPAPVILIPAGATGYFPASGDIKFADGEQIDLVATNTGGGVAGLLTLSGTVQLYN